MAANLIELTAARERFAPKDAAREAQLAEDKPAAFDALVPTIVPLVMGAAGEA